MTIDYRNYAFIREFPAGLIVEALVKGFLHVKPRAEPSVPCILRIDQTAPEFKDVQRLESLINIYQDQQIGIMVKDWRWESRNWAEAILTVNRESILSFRMLSRQCTDMELDMITMHRREQSCGACGYDSTSLQHANNLHCAYDVCPVCGGTILYRVH